MKKTLFYSVCALAYCLLLSNVNAQTSMSFETAEGYTLGNINNQNGWKVTAGANSTFVEKQEVSNEKATLGTQSLKIAVDANYAPQQNAVMGAFYDLANPMGSNQYTVEADLYISEANSTSSNFEFSIAGNNSFIARLQFNSAKNFLTAEPNTSGNLAWSIVPTATWNPTTWYRIKIEVIGAATKFYLNNNLIRTGISISSETLQHFRFTHNNIKGFAYIDNVVITNIKPVSTDTPEKFKLNIYPNPTTDLVNISLEENRLLNEVQIYDLNGRYIQNYLFNNTNQATLNVADLAQGVYYLKIKSEGLFVSKKLIKK